MATARVATNTVKIHPHDVSSYTRGYKPKGNPDEDKHFSPREAIKNYATLELKRKDGESEAAYKERVRTSDFKSSAIRWSVSRQQPRVIQGLTGAYTDWDSRYQSLKWVTPEDKVKVKLMVRDAATDLADKLGSAGDKEEEFYTREVKTNRHFGPLALGTSTSRQGGKKQTVKNHIIERLDRCLGRSGDVKRYTLKDMRRVEADFKRVEKLVDAELESGLLHSGYRKIRGQNLVSELKKDSHHVDDQTYGDDWGLNFDAIP